MSDEKSRDEHEVYACEAPACEAAAGAAAAYEPITRKTEEHATGTREAGELKAGELTFREGSEELETIVRQLEGNQLELEESLVLYERGVRLLRQLQRQLDAAEQKVLVLMGELEAQSDAAADTTLS